MAEVTTDTQPPNYHSASLCHLPPHQPSLPSTNPTCPHLLSAGQAPPLAWPSPGSMVAQLTGMKETELAPCPPNPSKKLSYLRLGYLENLKPAQILPLPTPNT